MRAETLVHEWGIITDLLPPDWRDLARSTGALQRARQVRDPSTLLLLILLHAGTGLSLRQAAARARSAGLAQISDVGLFKRMRGAAPWLQALAARMFATSPFRGSLPGLPASLRVRVVDATTICKPGSTGTDWRVHYVLRLPSLECDFFEVTPASGGESYKRVPVLPQDLILADRGYCHRDGAAHVLDCGGDLVVRLNARAFPLLEPGSGAPLPPLQMLRTLQGHTPAEWSVAFEARGRRYDARLCAIRKSALAAQQAQACLLRSASKKQKQILPETLELAEYVAVLTTLPATTSCVAVLELYRTRWQVELAFKRLKTLLGAGHVPKYDPESARAWIYGKLLSVLLIERLSLEARLFSPWGFPLRAT